MNARLEVLKNYFSKDIVDIIVQYDNTYRSNYSKCIREVKWKWKVVNIHCERIDCRIKCCGLRINKYVLFFNIDDEDLKKYLLSFKNLTM
jgi:hypothetical protein